jgi:hypothetical protein
MLLALRAVISIRHWAGCFPQPPKVATVSKFVVEKMTFLQHNMSNRLAASCKNPELRLQCFVFDGVLMNASRFILAFMLFLLIWVCFCCRMCSQSDTCLTFRIACRSNTNCIIVEAWSASLWCVVRTANIVAASTLVHGLFLSIVWTLNGRRMLPIVWWTRSTIAFACGFLVVIDFSFRPWSFLTILANSATNSVGCVEGDLFQEWMSCEPTCLTNVAGYFGSWLVVDLFHFEPACCQGDHGWTSQVRSSLPLRWVLQWSIRSTHDVSQGFSSGCSAGSFPHFWFAASAS